MYCIDVCFSVMIHTNVLSNILKGVEDVLIASLIRFLINKYFLKIIKFDYLLCTPGCIATLKTVLIVYESSISTDRLPICDFAGEIRICRRRGFEDNCAIDERASGSGQEGKRKKSSGSATTDGSS